MDTPHPDLIWWTALADTLPWTFAKTMAATPHSYIVRGKDLPVEDFRRAVRVIRRYGTPGRFYKQTYIYLTLPTGRFWTMGEPLGRCTIINRAEPDSPWYGDQDAPDTASPLKSVYDVLAPDYDGRYHSPECEDENAEVVERVSALVPQAPKPTVLDIGAGTGLTLDLRLTMPAKYHAVDPSQAMLNELVRKHRAVRSGQVHARPYTADMPLALESFDLVLALFGAASYLTPEALESIPDRLAPGGRAFLMLYAPGYAPSYYGDPSQHTATWAESHATAVGMGTALGAVDKLTNYTVVTL